MMYGYRARIGYTSPPASTEVFPYEFYAVVPKGITLVLTTLAVADVTPEEVARSMTHLRTHWERRYGLVEVG